MNPTTSQKPDADGACYVYGIVPATAHEPRESRGVGSPPAPVTFVQHGRVAALVSEIDAGGALGTPEDLRAHAKVLEDMVADHVPVLPFRFGGVLRDPDAVARDLLEPSEERFSMALGALGGLVQCTLRGLYREDRVLEDILADRPDIARLRDETRDMSEDVGYYRRIQLGEMVSKEIDTRRGEDNSVMLERLAPLAVAVAPGTPSAAQAVDASFLVDREDLAEFEAAADELAQDWADRVELRLLGPLPPYDFVAGIVDRAVEEAG